MMKKILFVAMAALMMVGAQAQDVQLHYDFGRDINKPLDGRHGSRPRMTLTYENFSADKWGSWYYFVDLDFFNRGMQGAYTEISREFTFAKPNKEHSSLAAHIEYDGGFCVGRHSGENDKWASIYQQAVLVGPAYNWHSLDFSKTFSVQAMYKQYFKGYDDVKGYPSFQLTGVWSTTFANKALTFSGFADLWRGKKTKNGHGQLVFLTEPQLWYNFNTLVDGLNLSIGTEWEISNNFCVNNTDGKTFFWNPTIALKWNF